jgi:hypothetical protein
MDRKNFDEYRVGEEELEGKKKYVNGLGRCLLNVK